ncbi:hypothetical protein ERJ75_001750900 [Trypanosoma vivax]|nr:hypothetical protein ERJ75_001750900 [Trypanosoma vivax]
MRNLPPMTPEEKAARERRLQADHERYVKSIESMRSLPRLQSTIAGAGGKTNERIRIAEEREMERRQRLQANAERLLEKVEQEQAHQAKVQALDARQKKRRLKASRRKEKRTRRRLEEREGGEAVGSEEVPESDDDDDTALPCDDEGGAEL